jgi:hypothetical protein
VVSVSGLKIGSSDHAVIPVLKYLSVNLLFGQLLSHSQFFHLPVNASNILVSHDLKQFQTALKGFLYVHSFYFLDEYFKYKMD